MFSSSVWSRQRRLLHGISTLGERGDVALVTEQVQEGRAVVCESLRNCGVEIFRTLHAPRVRTVGLGKRDEVGASYTRVP